MTKCESLKSFCDESGSIFKEKDSRLVIKFDLCKKLIKLKATDNLQTLTYKVESRDNFKKLANMIDFTIDKQLE